MAGTARLTTAGDRKFYIYLDKRGGLTPEEEGVSWDALTRYIQGRNTRSSVGALRGVSLAKLRGELLAGEAIGFYCDAGYVTVFSPHPLGSRAIARAESEAH